MALQRVESASVAMLPIALRLAAQAVHALEPGVIIDGDKTADTVHQELQARLVPLDEGLAEGAASDQEAAQVAEMTEATHALALHLLRNGHGVYICVGQESTMGAGRRPLALDGWDGAPLLEITGGGPVYGGSEHLGFEVDKSRDSPPWVKPDGSRLEAQEAEQLFAGVEVALAPGRLVNAAEEGSQKSVGSVAVQEGLEERLGWQVDGAGGAAPKVTAVLAVTFTRKPLHQLLNVKLMRNPGTLYKVNQFVPFAKLSETFLVRRAATATGAAAALPAAWDEEQVYICDVNRGHKHKTRQNVRTAVTTSARPAHAPSHPCGARGQAKCWYALYLCGPIFHRRWGSIYGQELWLGGEKSVKTQDFSEFGEGPRLAKEAFTEAKQDRVGRGYEPAQASWGYVQEPSTEEPRPQKRRRRAAAAAAVSSDEWAGGA